MLHFIYTERNVHQEKYILQQQGFASFRIINQEKYILQQQGFASFRIIE